MANTKTIKTFNPYEVYEDIYGYDSLDVMSREEIGPDYSYHRLVKNVTETRTFNYHSDYWGYAEDYQEKAVEFMKEIKPYISKKVAIECNAGDTLIVNLVGVLIDRQYNSHLKLLVEYVEDN